MQLKIYQENAIDDLLVKTKKLLGYSGNKKLVFKSPTGSGKTIMMAEFLKQLVDDREVRSSLGFIWAAPRKLHIQSQEKLENYFESSRALKCSFFEDLEDRKIDENEILFFNWESINKANAIYIRDNEQEFNLSKVLERTKEDGRKIVLIIDESQFAAGLRDKKEEQAANKLRRDINADLTIEVSATPILKDPDETTTIQIEDVKKEGMIKKAVILNDGFKNLKKGKKIKSKLSGGTEELVINKAIEKRQELIRAYQKEKTDINPLILIQLPDRIGQTEDRVREKVESILKNKYKISTEKGNNKLAIWLSGEHVNKDYVEKHNSEVEVLIFKQAIALGWDCPRAQILVLFRQWHSPIFSIQTVGRIMRMPEPDKGHYKTEILNYGYVYTNLNDIEIQEDIAKDYITIYTSKRNSIYKPLNLLSCYSKRHREKTRLTPLFIEIFLKQAKRYNLEKKVNTDFKKVNLKIISDWKAENIDIIAGTHLVGDKKIRISAGDAQKIFDYFVREHLRPQFYPEDRSVNRVKESIYKFFEKTYKMKRGDGEDNAIKVVLSEKNIQQFINVIEKSKEEYQNETIKRELELEFEEKWNIKESLTYGSEYKKESRKKSLMRPFYVKYDSGLEEAFVDFLEKSKNIEWWFKNGDRDTTFFAVPYSNREQKPFYVDFIVKLRGGRIGLFDPHGLHLSDFKPKSDGLQKYIKSENKKGKKLFGGIVANTNQRSYKGRWIYFDKNSKTLKKNNFSNWKDLEL